MKTFYEPVVFFVDIAGSGIFPGSRLVICDVHAHFSMKHLGGPNLSATPLEFVRRDRPAGVAGHNSSVKAISSSDDDDASDA
ncbi:hypothetical protein KIN20_030061 [Parelaphostrongylus tenuis]|uniref:Uncharacterized protein n=1 Tax=Parelaphostrongylus tenuis TaxID=148309 RepID=A0AAD5WG21_PARTN|nr:hypothetical protein KIN20_030061 [Parelaphostrongylus tenuis]